MLLNAAANNGDKSMNNIPINQSPAQSSSPTAFATAPKKYDSLDFDYVGCTGYNDDSPMLKQEVKTEILTDL